MPRISRTGSMPRKRNLPTTNNQRVASPECFLKRTPLYGECRLHLNGGSPAENENSEFFFCSDRQVACPELVEERAALPPLPTACHHLLEIVGNSEYRGNCTLCSCLGNAVFSGTFLAKMHKIPELSCGMRQLSNTCL